MKKLIFAFSFLAISFNLLASTKDLECIGDLTKDNFNRRTHLTFNEENSTLEGYRGALEVGLIAFKVKQTGDKVLLIIAQDEGEAGDKIFSSKKVSINEDDISLTTKLDDNFEASLVCFKK
ncbi:MAG: hypothetical protein PHY93_07265 [Bacteriovorax sp.]|nr:hypothetical protein [Bacteriovorax sp.]